MKIFCDEFSVPTYSETVVDVTMEVLGQTNLTNSDFRSRCVWAKMILNSVGTRKSINCDRIKKTRGKTKK
jgi:hypothetical protein